jgi:hypothetical protein
VPHRVTQSPPNYPSHPHSSYIPQSTPLFATSPHFTSIPDIAPPVPIDDKETMPPLHLRQEFPTLKAFKEALHAWAIEEHFEPRILKSDTGRVRVGCKRDPNCPFVVRCNWERKVGREPLARVTVLKERHTCLNALEWRGASVGVAAHGGVNAAGMNGGMIGVNGGLNGGNANPPPMPALEIRQDENGNIVGGARVLGPIPPRHNEVPASTIVPVLPKVQRNSASRLPFLIDILPRLMTISKDTTPMEIRECLLREYGAEVHVQQCRRAKTEILKKRDEERPSSMETVENGQTGGTQGQNNLRGQNNINNQSLDGMGSDSANDASQQLFGDMNATPNESPHPFQLHTASGVVIPTPARKSEAALNAVGEAPVRCPYCVNHRWMKSIKDAVEHMSMHVVV